MRELVILIMNAEEVKGQRGKFIKVRDITGDYYTAFPDCEGRELLKNEATVWIEYEEKEKTGKLFRNIKKVSPYHIDEERADNQKKSEILNKVRLINDTLTNILKELDE